MSEKSPLMSIPSIESDAINLAASGMRLKTLVYIRWLAVLGQALTVILVHFADQLLLCLVNKNTACRFCPSRC